MNNKRNKGHITERDVLGWVISIVGFTIGVGLGLWILIEMIKTNSIV
jgi:hypothetical protein